MISHKDWVDELYRLYEESLNWVEENNLNDFAPPTLASIVAIDELFRNTSHLLDETCWVSDDGMGGISIYWKAGTTRLTLRSQGDPATISLYTMDKVWRDPTPELLEEVWKQTFGETST